MAKEQTWSITCHKVKADNDNVVRVPLEDKDVSTIIELAKKYGVKTSDMPKKGDLEFSFKLRGSRESYMKFTTGLFLENFTVLGTPV